MNHNLQMKITRLPLDNRGKTHKTKARIAEFVESIQVREFGLPIKKDTNDCILNADSTYIHNNESFFWYAHDPEGSIIGSIGLKPFDINMMELKKLFIHADHRGSGLADLIHSTALGAAKDHGIESIYLGTVEELKSAHRFYDKNGYQRISKADLPSKFKVGYFDNVFYSKNI